MSAHVIAPGFVRLGFLVGSHNDDFNWDKCVLHARSTIGLSLADTILV